MTTNLKLNTANWFKKQLLLLGLFILAMLPLVGHAQQYPVRIIPVITPPYSLKLADYAYAPESKLQLQVLMTDLQQPQHHTGIKFFLQAGLNAQPIAQSNEFVIGQRPFLLTPGANITLTSSQLKHLFDPQNLNGLNPQQYASPLPEGLYQFCFQAYDFYTKNNLSEKACASVFLNQYDPPQLNIPQNAEKIQALNPYGNGSGILFQWMPRQVAPNTKYNFILKEIWDTNQSPISAFLASPVLWKEETLAPNLYYSIDKTQLILGRRYAWQVQAFSSNPFDNFNNFTNHQIQSANYKNNGLSEIFFFDYVENCQTPTFLMAKNKGRGRVEIHWNFLGNPTGLYKIQYRKKGANTPWMHTEAYQNSAFISGLEDLTEYEYRVGAVCGQTQTFSDEQSSDNAYAFSPVQFFTTDSQDLQNNNFQCGVMPAVDISNKEPLRQSLVANDTFTAGDFPVTIIDAQGNNGIFSGTGFIQVPYLADTKIKVAFQNITINSDKKLISGTVETEYDPNESAVHFASTGLGELFGDAGIKDITLDYNVSNVQFIATPPPGKIIIIGDNSKENNDDTGSGTGSTQELPAGRDYTIIDKNGNVWSVDEDGNITSGGTLADGGKSTPQNTDGVDADGSANAITAKGIKVDFENTSNSKYAFDKPKKLISDDYKDISGYIIPFKAVENKKTEPFIAKISITDNSIKADSLIFKTSKGVAIEAKKIDGTNDFELTLKGTYSYDKEEIQAVIKQNGKYQIAGVFNLVHISPKNIKLNLVPTTGVKIADEAISQIKNIYSKVAINLDITTKPEFDISNFLVNGKLPTEDEFGDLSTYSQAQNNIISKYKADNKDVGLEYYIFVTDKPSSSGQGGYMRLNGQFGFVFNQSARTIAHELAHGALKLEHPFKQFKNLTKGETSSIMDYAEGTNFIFPEWKQINDPKLKLYAFQKQSEGENIANHFNYLMPNKVPFRFKNTDGKLATDVILVNPNNNGGNPNGTLYGFNLNGIEYTYKDGEFTSSIDTTYVNQYSEKYRGDYFRLVIQDTSDKCKYYLVNRKITDFNKLNLTPNNRPYNLCNKEKLPLGGSGNANGTETREDILQKLNGIIANKLKEKFPEKEIKFSILDKKDTLYQQKLDEAIKQANYVIAIMDEDGKIKIKSSFQIPRWFANVLPNLGKLPDEDCSYEYINEGLTSLQNSDLYKISPRAEQIAMEMGVIAYRGLFGVLYCMTDEKKFVNSSFTQQFIGGAMHETIATFDVAQIVGGVISLVKSGAEKQIEAPINYYNNLKNISQKGSATPEEALQVILIPPMNTQIEGITKGIEIGNQFIKYYFTECDKTQLKDGTIANLCGYRYGQITIMVVPLVITAGEWAITKIGKIAELTKLSQTLATNIVKLDTQLATRGLMLAEEGGYTIIKNLENGSEITRIASKDAAEIEKVLQSLATDTKQIESFLAKYPQLKTIVDDLGDLKQFFIEDFGKANENILIELSKPNSKLFNSWKNYRHKFKTQIICK